MEIRILLLFACKDAERTPSSQPRQLRPFRDHGTRPKGRVNERGFLHRSGFYTQQDMLQKPACFGLASISLLLLLLLLLLSFPLV